MEIKYCYHTHTKRCGHAYGNDEEYVLEAINIGIKYLGFSDHVFLPRIDYQPWMRGNISLLDDYLSSIHHLKEKYQNQIEIHLGFEAEYAEEFLDYYQDLLNSHKVEYLILGQHCQFINDKCYWYDYSEPIALNTAKIYTKDLIKGMETGLFTYVCHPDLYVTAFEKWNDVLEECAHKIFQAAERLHIPLEINGGRLRNPHHNPTHLIYPCENFWKLAKLYNVEVVIGVDAHAPRDFNKKEIERLEDFAKEMGITINHSYQPFKNK